MAFYPFDISTPHVAYVLLGGFVVLFGMFSLLIREKLYVGEAIWAFVFGIIIGPYGGNIFNPRQWGNDNPETINQITLEVTRVVLAIGVFAIGVELPNAYMRKHWRSLAFLLGPVMTYGWFVTAGLIFALIPRLDFLSSLVIASCMTPTDPILAAAVVGGKYAEKHVPTHLRHLLTAESGCNDGAAFPFLFIALYLVLESTPGAAVAKWFWWTWLYEIALGVILGALVGFGFRHLMKFCEQRDLIDRKSYVAQYVSLALFSDGVTLLLGSDDLISSFAAGTAFAWDGFFNKQTEDSVFSSVIDLLFNIACFIYIGAWMPFSSFTSDELSLAPWRLVVLALLVMLLRRLPIMVALYRWIPDVKTFREAVFSGHFGPIGVGAVFIATLAAEKLPHPEPGFPNQVDVLAGSIEPIVAFMVLVSILIHGLSIPFFSLGKRVHSVSRTWSRHQSLSTGAAPEWANQIRKIVTHPDEIVVNRDDLEVGPTIVEEKDITHEHGEISRSGTLKDHDLETKKEWREGHHLIIERMARNGECEVEVVRNAFLDDEIEGSPVGKLTQTFRGAEAMVRTEVDKYLGTLRKSMSGRRSRGSQRSVRSERPHQKDDDQQSVNAADNPPAAIDAVREQGDDSNDRDEDYEDIEDEDKETREPKPRSQSPKKMVPSKPKHAVFIQSRGTGRRRNSIRRVILAGSGPNMREIRPVVTREDSPPSPSSSRSSSSIEEEDEAPRGRSSATEPKSPTTPTTPGPASEMKPVGSSSSIASAGGGIYRPRFTPSSSSTQISPNHQVSYSPTSPHASSSQTQSRPSSSQLQMRTRFDNIRGDGRRREGSPARSIRFAVAEVTRRPSWRDGERGHATQGSYGGGGVGEGRPSTSGANTGANTPRGFFTPFERSTEDLPGQNSGSTDKGGASTPVSIRAGGGGGGGTGTPPAFNEPGQK